MPLDAPSSVLLKPLAFITAFHAVRPLNPAYVERLRQKVRAIGVKPYPLSVTPAGVLFGGRHGQHRDRAGQIQRGELGGGEIGPEVGGACHAPILRSAYIQCRDQGKPVALCPAARHSTW